MQFTRLFSFLFTVAAVGLFVHASPAPSKRQVNQAQISTIMNTLQSSVESVLPNIKALNPSTATASDVSPYLQQIETAFTTASSSLSSIPSGTKRDFEVTERQTALDQEIAALVAGLLEDVAAALQGLLGVPGLGALLPGLDGPINTLLIGLEAVLAGVLTLVAALLVDVAGLLESLALGLTLATLGL